MNDEVMKFMIRKTVEEHLRKERPVSYTHLRAHETVLDIVCRLLLDTKPHIIHILHLPLTLHNQISIVV